MFIRSCPLGQIGFALALCVVGGVVVGCSSDMAPGLVIPDLVYGLNEHFPAPKPALPSPMLVVTNSGDDTLSVLELPGVADALNESVRYPIGLNPVEREGLHHAAVDAQNGFIYVGLSFFVPGGGSGPHGAHGTGTADGNILKLRASDLSLVGQVRVDRNPGDLLLSADGKTLYVTHYDLLRLQEGLAQGKPAADLDSRLVVVDTETMTRRQAVKLCPAAHGLRPSATGDKMYVSCATDELAIVDLTRSDLPVTRVPVGAAPSNPAAPVYEPYTVFVAPSGDVWVSCIGSNELRVYSATMNQFEGARTVTLPGPPLFVALSADASTLYVPVQGVDALVSVRLSDGAIVGQRALGTGCKNPHQVMLHPDGMRVMVVCEGDHITPGSVALVPVTSMAPVVTIPVGVFPDSIGLVTAGGPT